MAGNIFVEGTLKPAEVGLRVAEGADIGVPAEGGGEQDLNTALDGKEDALGNPAFNDYALVSQTDGTRTWMRIGRFRGGWNTTDTYLSGDSVHRNIGGTERLYQVTADQLPDSQPPESNNAWQRIDANDIVVQKDGSVVIARAGTLNFTGAGVTVNANGTIDIPGGGGGGGAVAPTLYFNRTNAYTVPTPTTSIKEQVVENSETGTTLQTVTLWSLTSALAGNRVTIYNNRPDASARVRVALGTGDEIVNYFGDIPDLLAGESLTFIALDENNWAQIAESDIPLFPSFTGNPQNDTSTFMFSVNGDSPTTWTRDRNTSINLNRASGTAEGYELANPATSGITVLDGEGYIFRNVGAIAWNIFPFASSNQFFVGATQYTAQSPYSLASNNTLVVLYNTNNSRWEGTLFNFLIPIPGGAGAGGSEGSSESGQEGHDVGRYNAYNRSGSTLSKGTGVNLYGYEGTIGFDQANNANFLNGFITDESADDMLTSVVTLGEVEAPLIYDNLNPIGEPLAVDTALYWSQGQSRLRIDDESGIHIECAKITSSAWNYAVTQHNATQTIDTQGEWDTWVFKTNMKNFVTAGEFQIPDIAEGSAEVTAVAGQKFIVSLPQGNGTLSLRPRGASVIENHPVYNPGTLPTYTNASALGMTGAIRDEYIVIEVNSSANGYWYYKLNQDGLTNKMLFSASEYDRKFADNARYNMSTVIQQNTSNISQLLNPPTTYINSDNFNASIPSCGTHYVIARSTRATVTINASQPEVGNNQACKFVIDNKDSSFPVTVINGGGNFKGMDGDRFNILPGETRMFTMTNEGGTLKVAPMGAVVYEFDLEVPTRETTNIIFDYISFPTTFDGIITNPTTPSTEVDRIVADTGIKSIELDVSMSPTWGDVTGAYGDYTGVTMRMDTEAGAGTGKNAVTFSVQHLNIATAHVPFRYKFIRDTIPATTGFVKPVFSTTLGADVNIIDINVHVKVVLKEA